MGSLPLLSSVCSIALVPAALLSGSSGFLTLVVINFVLFHAIWLVPRLRGSAVTNQFFWSQMRVPLALFGLGGLIGMAFKAA